MNASQDTAIVCQSPSSKSFFLNDWENQPGGPYKKTEKGSFYYEQYGNNHTKDNRYPLCPTADGGNSSSSSGGCHTETTSSSSSLPSSPH